MATTTIDSRTTNENRVFFWSIAIIIAVALAIVFTVRRTSVPDTSPTMMEKRTAPSDPVPPAPVLNEQTSSTTRDTTTTTTTTPPSQPTQ